MGTHIQPGAGSGDMTKATYDPDLDGKIAESELTLNYPTIMVETYVPLIQLATALTI